MPTITLSNGGTTLVDEEDFERLSRFRWSHSPLGYVQAWVDGKVMLMHRLLMNAQKGDEVDHINRDKRDNRKSNLRFATRRQNMLNVAYNREAGNMWKGTTKRRGGKWEAQMCYKGTQLYLGLFATRAEAAKAYRAAANAVQKT